MIFINRIYEFDMNLSHESSRKGGEGMDISYDYYRIFYYVARYGSFTRAAQILMNNQPNMTRMIGKLEQELGCTLFVRQNRGVSLTPEGETLYRHVSIAFEHIQTGEEAIARDRSLQSGVVTIAASEIALHCTVLPRLKQFHQLYPGVRIRVLNHSTPQAITLLKNGLADLAVVTTSQKAESSLHSTALRSIQDVPVCSRAFSDLEGRILSWKQLKEYPIISLEHGTESFPFFAALFSEEGVEFAPDIEVSTADQILPMVRSDLGIGFVPLDFLEQNGGRENLLILEMEKEIPRRQICLLKRKHQPLGIAAGKLEQMLLDRHWQS